MEIPYTTEVRPDTGLTNPKLGIWLFLASEVMLFGSLFSSVRAAAERRADMAGAARGAERSSRGLRQAVLIASSVTMVMAWASLLRTTAASIAPTSPTRA